MLKKLFAYARLMRLDKPIGTLLLLWPTLSALWLAKNMPPPLTTLLIFIFGVFLMRSAGCVINDIADRNFDGHVKRTRLRPLPSGAVSVKEAKWLFIVLTITSFMLVLTLNPTTIKLSFVGLALAFTYPFMKRYTHLPQFILGVAYSWSIPMAWAAMGQPLSANIWLLFIANLCWTIAYDTLYAMVDREDDLKIGLKSTAILFGSADRLIIGLLQCLTLVLLFVIGFNSGLKGTFYAALILIGGLFVYQQRLISKRQPERCFQAFLNNNYCGMIMFLGIAFSL